MAKLYTCTGDGGYTSLANGKRVLKSEIVIELLGTIDEFSSMLGVAKAHTEDETLRGDIEKIQKTAVTVMAEIAGGDKVVADDIIKIAEELTDRYCQSFSGFTLSGETKVSAFLDVARCIVRRAERIAAGMYHKGDISKNVMCWTNRISDLVYAMGRYAAKE